MGFLRRKVLQLQDGEGAHLLGRYLPNRRRLACAAVTVLVLLAAIGTTIGVLVYRKAHPNGLGDLYGAGLCYSPEHDERYFNAPVQIPQVLREDFAAISRSGGTVVRTYYPLYNPTGIDPYPVEGLPTHIARDHNLKVLLGIPWASQYVETFITSAVYQAKHYRSHVAGICVGNEDVRTVADAQQVIAVANRLRGESVGVPIGTAQRTDHVHQFPDAYALLNGALDFVGVNVYPSPFPSSKNVSQDVITFQAQTEELETIFPGKLVLTETGIPSGGIWNGEGGFTPQMQREYRTQVSVWWGKRFPSRLLYVFEAFDEPRKQSPDCSPDRCSTEKTYGVWTSSRGDKQANNPS